MYQRLVLYVRKGILCLAGLCLMGMCGASAAWAVSEKNVDVMLGAGDRVLLYSSSQTQFNRRYLIDEKGSIQVPLLGKVKIAGLRLSGAERHLTRRLSVIYRNLSTIRVRLVRRMKYVEIRGWIKQPGRYHLPWKGSLDLLIQKAKGLRRGARLDQIWIYTAAQGGQRFDLRSYYTSRGKRPLPLLPRNAMVFVPMSAALGAEAGSLGQTVSGKGGRIAVMGAVRRAGAFPCFRPIDLLQALTLAGGTLPKAGIQEILISQGTSRVLWFDLRAYWRGKRARLPMIKAGSVVYVPYAPVGVSRRSPIRLLGEVGKPGILRGTKVRDLPALLAMRGGLKSQADITRVTVVYEGPNFTISQKVNVKRAIHEGDLSRLPPMPASGMLTVMVPSRPRQSVTWTNVQSVLQLVLAAASVVTSAVLISLTIPNENQNNQPANP